ncbi:MAG TPA: sugar kinase, partial [Myxococcota bacterium]|nr:sugar kinase [Myxococcota bacterium]
MDELGRWLQAFRGRPLVVVGDLVADEYLHGLTERISREAPVLVVREESREVRPGGAANTAANLAALGAAPRLLG